MAMGRLSKILRVLRATGLMAVIMAAGPAAAGSQLPLARDLAADAAEANARGAAILVFYMTDACPYCERVEELYLEPMLTRRPYGDRLLIRAIRADRATALRDFAGNSTEHAAFARRAGAYVTPLVQLYGPDGTALAEPLLGYTSPDFYAGQLESRIEQAIASVPRRAARAP